MNSIHSNYYDDRRFKWKHCVADGLMLNQEDSEIVLDNTALDDNWKISCGGNTDDPSTHAAITRAYSGHSNFHEDRRWQFTCTKLNTGLYALRNCEWSDWANNYDENFETACP